MALMMAASSCCLARLRAFSKQETLDSMFPSFTEMKTGMYNLNHNITLIAYTVYWEFYVIYFQIIKIRVLR